MKRNPSEVITFEVKYSKIKSAISSLMIDSLRSEFDSPTKKEADAIADFMLNSPEFIKAIKKEASLEIGENFVDSFIFGLDFEKFIKKCPEYQSYNKRVSDKEDISNLNEIKAAKEFLEQNGYAVTCSGLS